MNRPHAKNKKPIQFFYPSTKLDLTCPSCRFQATAVLKVPLIKKMTVMCKKCQSSFLIKPNSRGSYRKKLGVEGFIARHSMEMAGQRTVVMIPVTIADISQGGIGVTVATRRVEKHNLVAGETLYASFAFPGKERDPLHVKGVIRHISSRGGDADSSHVGVEFDEISPGVASDIQFFLM